MMKMRISSVNESLSSQNGMEEGAMNAFRNCIADVFVVKGE
jgi:hypothetical protein